MGKLLEKLRKLNISRKNARFVKAIRFLSLVCVLGVITITGISVVSEKLFDSYAIDLPPMPTGSNDPDSTSSGSYTWTLDYSNVLTVICNNFRVDTYGYADSGVVAENIWTFIDFKPEGATGTIDAGVQKIVFTGTIDEVTFYEAFKTFTNCTEIDMSGLTVTKLSNAKNMFYGLNKLQTVKLPQNFNIASANCMFYNCQVLTTITNLDTIKFDTTGSNCTLTGLDANHMFYNCKEVTQLPLPALKYSDMEYMFYYCKKVTEFDLSSSTTVGTISLSNTFSYCQKALAITLPSSGMVVDAMDNAFYWCSILKQIENFDKLDLSDCSTFYSAFSLCYKLESVNFNDSTLIKTKRIDFMFNNCNTIEYIDISMFRQGIDVFSNLVDVNAISTFNGCSSLKTLILPEEGFAVGQSSSMFSSCRELEEITNLDKMIISDSINSLENMFCACFKLKNVKLNSSFKASNVTNMSTMFMNCRDLTEVDISNFVTNGTNGVLTNCTGMFEACINLRKVTLPNDDKFFNQCTSFNHMFELCITLQEIYNLDKMDTSNSKNFLNMFFMNKSLKNEHFVVEGSSSNYNNFSKFDMSSAEVLMGMFDGCLQLTTIDISTWETTNKLYDLTSVFDYCENLETVIGLEDLCMTNVSSTANMFRNCKKLTTETANKVGEWTIGTELAAICGMFKNCESIEYLNVPNFELGGSRKYVYALSGNYSNYALANTLIKDKFPAGVARDYANITYIYNSNMGSYYLSSIVPSEDSYIDNRNGANIVYTNQRDDVARDASSDIVYYGEQLYDKHASGFVQGCKNLETLDISGLDFDNCHTVFMASDDAISDNYTGSYYVVNEYTKYEYKDGREIDYSNLLMDDDEPILIKTIDRVDRNINDIPPENLALAYDCPKLKSVTLNANLTSLGVAFYEYNTFGSRTNSLRSYASKSSALTSFFSDSNVLSHSLTTKKTPGSASSTDKMTGEDYFLNADLFGIPDEDLPEGTDIVPLEINFNGTPTALAKSLLQGVSNGELVHEKANGYEYYYTDSTEYPGYNYEADNRQAEIVVKIKSWDISENEDESVIATLYSTGELVIDGNGTIRENLYSGNSYQGSAIEETRIDGKNAKFMPWFVDYYESSKDYLEIEDYMVYVNEDDYKPGEDLGSFCVYYASLITSITVKGTVKFNDCSSSLFADLHDLREFNVIDGGVSRLSSNTGKNLSYMFKNDFLLKSLDLRALVYDSVNVHYALTNNIDLSYIVYGNFNLEYLDLTSFSIYFSSTFTEGNDLGLSTCFKLNTIVLPSVVLSDDPTDSEDLNLNHALYTYKVKEKDANGFWHGKEGEKNGYSETIFRSMPGSYVILDGDARASLIVEAINERDNDKLYKALSREDIYAIDYTLSGDELRRFDYELLLDNGLITQAQYEKMRNDFDFDSYWYFNHNSNTYEDDPNLESQKFENLLIEYLITYDDGGTYTDVSDLRDGFRSFIHDFLKPQNNIYDNTVYYLDKIVLSVKNSFDEALKNASEFIKSTYKLFRYTSSDSYESELTLNQVDIAADLGLELVDSDDDYNYYTSNEDFYNNIIIDSLDLGYGEIEVGLAFYKNGSLLSSYPDIFIEDDDGYMIATYTNEDDDVFKLTKDGNYFIIPNVPCYGLVTLSEPSYNIDYDEVKVRLPKNLTLYPTKTATIQNFDLSILGATDFEEQMFTFYNGSLDGFNSDDYYLINENVTSGKAAMFMINADHEMQLPIYINGKLNTPNNKFSEFNEYVDKNLGIYLECINFKDMTEAFSAVRTGDTGYPPTRFKDAFEIKSEDSFLDRPCLFESDLDNLNLHYNTIPVNKGFTILEITFDYNDSKGEFTLKDGYSFDIRVAIPKEYTYESYKEEAITFYEDADLSVAEIDFCPKIIEDNDEYTIYKIDDTDGCGQGVELYSAKEGAILGPGGFPSRQSDLYNFSCDIEYFGAGHEVHNPGNPYSLNSLCCQVYHFMSDSPPIYELINLNNNALGYSFEDDSSDEAMLSEIERKNLWDIASLNNNDVLMIGNYDTISPGEFLFIKIPKKVSVMKEISNSDNYSLQANKLGLNRFKFGNVYDILMSHGTIENAIAGLSDFMDVLVKPLTLDNSLEVTDGNESYKNITYSSITGLTEDEEGKSYKDDEELRNLLLSKITVTYKNNEDEDVVLKRGLDSSSNADYFVEFDEDDDYSQEGTHKVTLRGIEPNVIGSHEITFSILSYESMHTFLPYDDFKDIKTQARTEQGNNIDDFLLIKFAQYIDFVTSEEFAVIKAGKGTDPLVTRDVSVGSSGTILLHVYEESTSNLPSYPKYHWYFECKGPVYFAGDNHSLFSVESSEISQLISFTISPNVTCDFSKATDLSCMFINSSKLTSVDFGIDDDEYFDLSNATNLAGMFQNCNNLTSINYGMGIKTTNKLKDISGMFNNAFAKNNSTLYSLDLGDEFDTSGVTTMQNMFYKCFYLEAIDLGDKFSFQSADNIASMFDSCTNLVNLDTSKIDASHATNVRGIFKGCTSLTTLNLTKFDISNITKNLYGKEDGTRIASGTSSLVNITFGKDTNFKKLVSDKINNVLGTRGIVKQFYQDPAVTGIDLMPTKITFASYPDLTSDEKAAYKDLIDYIVNKNEQKVIGETEGGDDWSLGYNWANDNRTIFNPSDNDVTTKTPDKGTEATLVGSINAPTVYVDYGGDSDIYPDNLKYTWQKLASDGTTWNNLTSSDTSTYNTTELSLVPNSDTKGYYRCKVENGPLVFYSSSVNFDVVTNKLLTVSSEDTDKGTVSGDSGMIDVGETVTVSALANDGYGFKGWYDEDNNFIAGTCEYTFIMPNEDMTLVAKFNEITLDVTGTYTYKNAQIIPTIEVKNGDTLLTLGDDYEVSSYGANIHAGDDAGSVTVLLKGDYSGTITKTFDIEKLDVDIELEMYMDGNFTMEYSGTRFPGSITVSSDIKDEDSNVIDKINFNLKRSFNNKTASNGKPINHYCTSLSFDSGSTENDINMIHFYVTTHLGKVDYLSSFKSNKTASIARIGDITPKEITYTYNGDKVYDGNSNASVTFTLKDEDILCDLDSSETIKPKDNVSLSVSTLTGKYKDSGVETSEYGEHDIILDSGKVLTLTGSDASNYKITQPQSLRGTIGTISIDSDAVTEVVNDVTYTGSVCVPNFTLTYGGSPLTLGTDYYLSCEDIHAGSASATITGIGNFTGTRTITFNILPKDITIDVSSYITNKEKIYDKGVTYYFSANNTDSSKVINYTDTDNSEVLNITLTGTYERSNASTLSDNKITIAGNVTSITGVSNLNDYNVTFSKLTYDDGKIKPKDLSTGVIGNLDSSYSYTGSTITPDVTLTLDGDTLTSDDYIISYSNNVNAGDNSASITITGKGNYTGEITGTKFTIDKHKIVIDARDYAVNRTKVYDGNNTYLFETDIAKSSYVITKENECGEEDVIITLTGTYDSASKGQGKTITMTGTFEVTGGNANKNNYDVEFTNMTFTNGVIGQADAQDLEFIYTAISDYEYTGEAFTPEPEFTLGGKTLTKEIDYTLSYENNTEVGTGKVTIIGQGNYTGTRVITFTINKKKIGLNDLDIRRASTGKAQINSSNPLAKERDGDNLFDEEIELYYTNLVTGEEVLFNYDEALSGYYADSSPIATASTKRTNDHDWLYDLYLTGITLDENSRYEIDSAYLSPNNHITYPYYGLIYDTTSPEVVSTECNADFYGKGQEVVVTLNMSEDVTCSDSGVQIVLKTMTGDNTICTCNYDSVSDNKVIFKGTIPSDNDTISTEGIRVELKRVSGNIYDLVNNPLGELSGDIGNLDAIVNVSGFNVIIAPLENNGTSSDAVNFNIKIGTAGLNNLSAYNAESLLALLNIETRKHSDENLAYTSVTKDSSHVLLTKVNDNEYNLEVNAKILCESGDALGRDIKASIAKDALSDALDNKNVYNEAAILSKRVLDNNVVAKNSSGTLIPDGIVKEIFELDVITIDTLTAGLNTAINFVLGSDVTNTLVTKEHADIPFNFTVTTSDSLVNVFESLAHFANSISKEFIFKVRDITDVVARVNSELNKTLLKTYLLESGDSKGTFEIIDSSDETVTFTNASDYTNYIDIISERLIDIAHDNLEKDITESNIKKVILDIIKGKKDLDDFINNIIPAINDDSFLSDIETVKVMYENLDSYSKEVLSNNPYDESINKLNTKYYEFINEKKHDTIDQISNGCEEIEVFGVNNNSDIESAYTDGVVLRVTKITDETKTKEINDEVINHIMSYSKAQNGKLMVPYDIALYKKSNNEEVQPKDNMPILVRLILPIEYYDKLVDVYHINKDGTFDKKIPVTKQNVNGTTYVYFEADSFSPFALFGEVPSIIVSTTGDKKGSSISPTISSYDGVSNKEIAVSLDSNLKANIKASYFDEDLGKNVDIFSKEITESSVVVLSKEILAMPYAKDVNVNVNVTFSAMEKGEEEKTKIDDPKVITTGTIITVQTLDHESYISGYKDNTFKPNGKITRAEAATILARLSKTFSENKNYKEFATNKYQDIKDNPNRWYVNYIGYVTANGIMEGYSGKFYPDKNMTRAEFAAAVVRFMDMDIVNTDLVIFKDYKNRWFKDEVDTLAWYGYVNGYKDGTFKGDNPITRAEAVKIINGVLNRNINDTTKVTSEYKKKLKDKFKDVSDNAWYYFDILEAALDHSSREH